MEGTPPMSLFEDETGVNLIIIIIIIITVINSDFDGRCSESRVGMKE